MRSANSTSYILFAYFSLFTFGLIDNARGPIYPKVIETFSLGNSESSWIFTLASLVSFFMTMAIPFWLPKLGAIKSSKIAMLFHVASLLCMGSSSLFGLGFWVFLAGSVFLGLGMGIQSVTVNLIVSKVATPFNSSKLFSGLHSMYGAASLLGPLALGAVFRFGVSWQWSILALALVPLAHFFVFLKLPTLNLDKAARAEGDVDYKRVLGLGIVFSFYVATEIMISSRMVVYLYESAGVALDIASYCLTGFFVCLLGGRILFSFYTPPVSSINLMRISGLASLIFLLLALCGWPYFIILTGASISFFFPVGMSYIKSVSSNPEGVIAKVMMFVGAMIAGMHFLFGVFSDAFGIRTAMWIGPVFVVVVVALLMLERDPVSKS